MLTSRINITDSLRSCVMSHTSRVTYILVIAYCLRRRCNDYGEMGRRRKRGKGDGEKENTTHFCIDFRKIQVSGTITWISVKGFKIINDGSWEAFGEAFTFFNWCYSIAINLPFFFKWNKTRNVVKYKKVN